MKLLLILIFCVITTQGYVQKRSTNKNCQPGKVTKWKEDCNTCLCDASGEVACTLMICIHTDNNNNIQKRSADVKCTPGTTFTQDCNTCVCSDTGFAVCTKRRCDVNH